MDLSRRQLQLFIALATHQNFTHAAKVANISQPALSLAIRRIETQLGVRLFERSARRVSLTSAGKAFFPSARRILRDINAVVNDMTEFADLNRGRISVACLPSLGADFVPTVLQELVGQHPKIAVAVHDGYNEQILSMIQSGEVDCGLCALLNDPPGLRATPLLSEGFDLLVPKGHRLADCLRVRSGDVVGEPFVEVTSQSTTRILTEQFFAQSNSRPERVISTTSVTTALGLVAHGFGVTVFPRLAQAILPTDQRIRYIPMDEPVLHRTIAFVQRDDSSLSPAATAFWRLVQRHAVKLQEKLDSN